MQKWWRYGNYCGPGPKLSPDCSSLDDGSPMPEPINKVDAACQIHDKQYCACGVNWKNSFPGTSCSRESDKGLLSALMDLINNKKVSGKELNAARLISTYFKTHHTFGNLLVPSLNFKEWLENFEGEDYTDGFWAGEGNAASGILPIANDTKRLCLAYRSRRVHMGNRFGTIGGAVQKGKTPQESALAELKEETNYSGDIDLVPAYVFKSGNFRYFNFLGLIPKEVPIKPLGLENQFTKWYDYNELQSIENEMHPGLIALLQNSKTLIESYLN